MLKFRYILAFLSFFVSSLSPYPSIGNPSAIIIQRVTLDGNNIKSFFQNTGIFNQDTRTQNTPGCEWPKGSGKHFMFSSGLSIGAYVHNNLAMVMASFAGEYSPGIIKNGIPVTGEKYRIYKVSKFDNCYTNLDYAEWKYIVPLGAPYEDINHNGQYDDCIDKPGVKDAAQTIFACLTDGFYEQRNAGEGFGGGIITPLLYADVRLTAWCYNYDVKLGDIQFIKYNIINQGNSKWDSTYFSLFTDCDLGNTSDDLVGCDTLLGLGFCYNGDNVDGDSSGGYGYGIAPPAAGMLFIKTAVDKNLFPYDTLGMTSFIPIGRNSGPHCESDPNGEPLGAYNYMTGLKKDRTPWMNPHIRQGTKKTKFVLSGAPYQDSIIQNCNGDTTGNMFSSFPGDKKFLMSTGSKYLTVNPGDTQNIVVAQLIKRGTDNIHSVEKLKEYTAFAKKFYDIVSAPDTNAVIPTPVIPVNYRLAQNYPNPFNPATTIEFDIIIKFNVELAVYDLMGKEISTLINRELEPGSYKVNFDASGLPSGVYYYKIKSGYFEEAKKMVVIR